MREMRRERVEELARDEAHLVGMRGWSCGIWGRCELTAHLLLADEDGEVSRGVVRVQLAARLQEAVRSSVLLLAGCRISLVVNVGAQLPRRLLAAQALQLPLCHFLHELGDVVKGRELRARVVDAQGGDVGGREGVEDGTCGEGCEGRGVKASRMAPAGRL